MSKILHMEGKGAPRKDPAWKQLRKQNQSKQILNNFQDLTSWQKKIFYVKLKSYDFVVLTLKDATMFFLKFPLIIIIFNLNVTHLESLTRSNRLLITHMQHWKGSKRRSVRNSYFVENVSIQRHNAK